MHFHCNKIKVFELKVVTACEIYEGILGMAQRLKKNSNYKFYFNVFQQRN